MSIYSKSELVFLVSSYREPSWIEQKGPLVPNTGLNIYILASSDLRFS